MGQTNSELLEELLLECYATGIIEEVREEVKKVVERTERFDRYEVYFESYKKIMKKYSAK